jgi:hypothetical protein
LRRGFRGLVGHLDADGGGASLEFGRLALWRRAEPCDKPGRRRKPGNPGTGPFAAMTQRDDANAPDPEAGPRDPEAPKRTEDSDPLAGEILRLVEQRGPGKSICPSEVARSFAEERRKPTDPPDLWRKYLPAVRQQAKNLARQGRISILRKGKPVDPTVPVKGVVRLSLPVGDDTRSDEAPE